MVPLGGQGQATQHFRRVSSQLEALEKESYNVKSSSAWLDCSLNESTSLERRPWAWTVCLKQAPTFLHSYSMSPGSEIDFGAAQCRM